MYCSSKLFLYIFVITLYGCDKCDSSILENDKGIYETYIQFDDSDYNINTPSFKSNIPLTLDQKLNELNIYDAIESENQVEETKTEAVKRVTRQAYYDTKSLYPRLPTAPYQQQPYQNQNSNFNSQANYTNPVYQQQWHRPGQYNYSQSGYPAYNPSYNNSYPTPTYNPSDYRSTNNPHGSYNNYNPNDKYNNPNSGPGYPYRNPGLPGAQSVNPYNPPGYPQLNNYSGYPPHTNYGRNNSYYNPVQTSTYPSGNTSNYQTPKYPFGNKYPNSFYSTTLPPSYNSTGYRPGQTNFPSNWTLTGRPTNRSQSYPPGPGYGRYQNNGSIIPYGANQHGVPNSNVNGMHQSWPYPTPNNVNNNYPQNYPAHGPGSTPYNNNQGMYPKQNQYGDNYYANNPFNGTSTYRLAESYTPSIPSQPPRNGPNIQNQFYYPTVMNGTHHDPTKVAPERFSY